MSKLSEVIREAGIIPEGWYYLHTNGSLIYKPNTCEEPQVEAGGFVREVWPVVTSHRETAWTIAVEALALGAAREEVQRLADKWQLTDDDAQEFVKRVNLRLFKDGNQWCATFADFKDLQTSQAGFGFTCLDALADLAKAGLIKSRQQTTT